MGFTPAIQYALATDEFRNLRVAFGETSRSAELRYGVPRNQVALRDSAQSRVGIHAVRPTIRPFAFTGSRAISTRNPNPPHRAWN